MRFGLVIAGGSLDEVSAQVIAAEESGFDVVWLAQSEAIPSPAVTAAALASMTSSIRIGIELQAGVNPVYLAEEAAVADLCLGGRLVLALMSDDAGRQGETADVLLAALAARPFRHEGVRWQIPANLDANVVNREERVRVTPAPAQLELPLWLSGPHAAHLARERCLTYIGAADESTDVLDPRVAAHRGPAQPGRQIGCAGWRCATVELPVTDEELVRTASRRPACLGNGRRPGAAPGGEPTSTSAGSASTSSPRGYPPRPTRPAAARPGAVLEAHDRRPHHDEQSGSARRHHDLLQRDQRRGLGPAGDHLARRCRADRRSAPGPAWARTRS